MRIQLTLELYEAGYRIRKELEKLYPNCFFPIGSEKPLKIGIMEDLLAIREELKLDPIPTEDELKTSILVYTGSLSYRASLIRDSSTRIDLDGNAVDSVTADERLMAKNKPLAPLWKLTPEEWNIAQARKQETEKLRRERYLAYKEQQETETSNISTEQKGALKNANDGQKTVVTKELSETPPEVLNPNLARPKLTLKNRG